MDRCRHYRQRGGGGGGGGEKEEQKEEKRKRRRRTTSCPPPPTTTTKTKPNPPSPEAESAYGDGQTSLQFHFSFSTRSFQSPVFWSQSRFSSFFCPSTIWKRAEEEAGIERIISIKSAKISLGALITTSDEKKETYFTFSFLRWFPRDFYALLFLLFVLLFLLFFHQSSSSH